MAPWPISLFFASAKPPPPPHPDSDPTLILARLTAAVETTLTNLTTATHALVTAKSSARAALSTPDLALSILQAAQHHQIRIDALQQQFAVAVKARDTFVAQMQAKDHLDMVGHASEALRAGNQGLTRDGVEEVMGIWEVEGLVAEGGVEGVRAGIERVLLGGENKKGVAEAWLDELLEADQVKAEGDVSFAERLANLRVRPLAVAEPVNKE